MSENFDSVKRVVLHSISGYDCQHEALLQNLIDKKNLLFCAVGKDCKLWHDAIDELFVAGQIERDFDLLTTWHRNESLAKVIDFAEMFDEFGGEIKIIEV
jgi:hypothetical protein